MSGRVSIRRLPLAKAEAMAPPGAVYDVHNRKGGPLYDELAVHHTASGMHVGRYGSGAKRRHHNRHSHHRMEPRNAHGVHSERAKAARNARRHTGNTGAGARKRDGERRLAIAMAAERDRKRAHV